MPAIRPQSPPTKKGSTDEMITASELCARWRVSRYTLARMRAANRGPAAYLFGRTFRYRLDDVRAHEQAARGSAGGAA